MAVPSSASDSSLSPSCRSWRSCPACSSAGMSCRSSCRCRCADTPPAPSVSAAPSSAAPPRRSSSRTPTGRRIIRIAPESAPTAISALCAAERIRNTRTLSSATARSARAIAAIASIISTTTFIFSETAYRAVGERHAAPVREAAKAAPIRRNAPPQCRTPLTCHCEPRRGRGNLGKAVTFSPWLSCDRAGYCEIATSLCSSQ